MADNTVMYAGAFSPDGSQVLVVTGADDDKEELLQLATTAGGAARKIGTATAAP